MQGNGYRLFYRPCKKMSVKLIPMVSTLFYHSVVLNTEFLQWTFNEMSYKTRLLYI